jgi:thioredoxin 2
MISRSLSIEVQMSHTYSVCKKCYALNKVDSEKGLNGQAVCGKCGIKLELSGLVTNVTGKDLNRILKKSELPIIVDFWAPWCGPCNIYGPEFEKASRENLKAVFLKVNTETEPVISADFGIRGIPCTIIFKHGREIKRQAGAMDSDQIKGLFGQF